MVSRAIASLVVVGLLATIPLTIAFIPVNELYVKMPTDANNMMNSEMMDTDSDTSTMIRCFCNLPKCLEATGGVQTCTTKLGCFSELQPILSHFDGVPSQNITTSSTTDVPIPKELDDEAAASAMVDENALRAKYGCLELMPINMTCRAILRSMEGEESEFPVLQSLSNHSNNNDYDDNDDEEDIIRAYHCCESNMCNDITHVAAAAPAAQAALAAIFQQIMAPLTANTTDTSLNDTKVVADSTGTVTNYLDNASPISSTPLLVENTDRVFRHTFVTVNSMTTVIMDDNQNTTKNVVEPGVSTENVLFMKYVNYTTGVSDMHYSVTDGNNVSSTETSLIKNSTFGNVTTSTVSAALNNSDIANAVTTVTESSVLNSSNVDVLSTVSTIMQDFVNYSTPANVVPNTQPFAVVKPTSDFIPTNAAVVNVSMVNVETTPKSVSDNSAAIVVPVILKEIGNDSATDVVTSSYDSLKTSTTNVIAVPVVSAIYSDNVTHLEYTGNATNTGNETAAVNMTINNEYKTSNGSATPATVVGFENYTRIENATANQTDSADVIGLAAATTVSAMPTNSTETMQSIISAEPITVVKSPEYNGLDANKKSHVISKRHDKAIVSSLTIKHDQDITLPITQKNQFSEPIDNQIFEEYPIDKELTEKVLNEIINQNIQEDQNESIETDNQSVEESVEESIETEIPTWLITAGGVILITTTMIAGTIFLGKIVRKLMRQSDISNITGQCSNPGKPCACSGGRPATDSTRRQQCRLDSSAVVIPMKPTMPVRSYNRGSHYVDSTGNTTYVYTRIPVPLSDLPMPRRF